MSTIQIQIDDELLERARKVATLDDQSVEELVANMLRQHIEHVDTFADLSGGLPRFSLDDYVLQRDPDESDADYEARLNLFR